MFIVPPAIQTQRLTICQACKHYKSSTRSCGTLVIGQKLTPEELAEAEANNQVTHYRKKTRLCGCVMPAKTKLALFRCPLNKWGYYRLTDKETIELKEFISSLPTDGKISGLDIRLAAEWFSRMTGRRVSCASCNAKMILNYIRSEVNNLTD
jgi:hypothetical protein